MPRSPGLFNAHYRPLYERLTAAAAGVAVALYMLVRSLNLI
ncbi:MAG: hypothetical protein ACXW6K_25170 [Candidatus Binatia bacterium]